MRWVLALVLALVLLLISEIECKNAKNRAGFKNKLKYALKDNDIQFNGDDIDIDEYCDFVDEYHDTKLIKYDADDKAELKQRFKIFKETKQNIKIWNENAKKIEIHGKVFEEKYGITPFADMTNDEKYAMLIDIPSETEKRRLITAKNCPRAASDKYDSVDYMTGTTVYNSRYCGPVKDQGNTNGCWEFATTGEAECNINWASYETGGEIISFSEQYVSDCTTPEQGTKLNGGVADYAIEYLSAKGLCKTDDYEWQWDKTRDLDGYCECNGLKYYSKCESFDHQNNNDRLLKATAAASWAFGMYLGEKFFHLQGPAVAYLDCEPATDPKTGQPMGHAMTVVGNWYGLPHIKNSWGTNWGDYGYLYLGVNVLTHSSCSASPIISRSYEFTTTQPTSQQRRLLNFA